MDGLIPAIAPAEPWQSRAKGWLKRAIAPPTVLFQRHRIAHYLSTEKSPKLHMGCGLNILPGWLNADLTPLGRRGTVYIDATKRLPFADGALSFIFTEHFIAHLSLNDGARFLQECYRVLRKGGVLRTTGEDLTFAAKMSLSSEPRYEAYHRWICKEFLGDERYPRCFGVNYFVYGHGHKFLFDAEAITWLLKRVGFSGVVPAKVGESTQPELRGVEGHDRVVGIPPEFDGIETFVVEATK